MSTSPSTQQSWLRAILPSSVASISVHVLILLVAGMSFRGCETGPPVDAGGQHFREIGIVDVPDRSDLNDDQARSETQDGATERPSVSAPAEEPQSNTVLPTEAPSIAELLTRQASTAESQEPTSETLRIIGPGTTKGSLPEVDSIPDIIPPRASAGVGSAGSITPGPGQTTFMNIISTGQSFVYVIDTSSSMSEGGRLELAKSQLMGSLRRLRPNQKFQVLFYHNVVTAMKFRNRAAQDMYPATPLHMLLAKNEVERVVSTGGTSHLPAILEALELEPDVIYFLTDGGQVGMTPVELQTVRTSNRKGSHIHVIEFASGSRETRNISSMQTLAQQSGGKYSRIVLR